MRRTPLKRTPLNAKKTPLRKISKKRKEEVINKIARNHKMQEFFYEIWNKRIHRCESCNAYLGSVPHTYNFDHLLEKSKYPELRLEELNIFLCCLSCHEKKTNGHPTEIHLKAINDLKQLYEISGSLHRS